MYPVTATYKTKIKELERVFQTKLQIQHSKGVLDLDDKDIALGSLIFNEASQAGEDFTIGGVVASDLTVNIVNKPEYADIQFVGATLTASIGLQLAEDKWELQEVEPDTWEEVQVSEEAWEWVPLGVFHIDEIGKTRNVIRIKAIDAMINLDMPYSLSKLVYPATLLQIFTNICNVCDIQQGSYTFPNSEHVVKDRPDVDSTFRDILAYVAELSGTFARTTRTGALELVWYEESGLTLTGANRFDFVPRDDRVQISGITVTVDGVTYIAGGGVETEVYSESGEDFEQGELDGVVAGEDGLELELSMGKALSFDGVDDKVNIGNYPAGTNPFTIELWLKPKAADNGMFLSNGLGTHYNRLFLRINNDKTIYFYTDDGSGLALTSNFTVTLDEWVHIAVTRSGTTGRIFIDGVEDVSGTVKGGNLDGGRDWHIGARSDNTFPHECSIRDLRIWNIARTEEDIANNMNKKLTGSESGLVHYWPMDEGSGNTIYDLAGDNDGTISGATWVAPYKEQGSRISLPLDLSSVGTVKTSEISWQATEPTDTSVKVLTAVTDEIEIIGEELGIGDGTEKTFYLDYYPAESYNDLVVYIGGTPVSGFTRPDVKNPRKIVFNEGHEPGDELVITANYTGVEYPGEDDWEEQTKDKTISNLPDDFTNKYLWVRQVLATEDSAITPVLESLKLYSTTEGGADYLVDLSNNPLLQDNYETALGTIYGAVKGVSFYPFTSQWQGDPAVQAGDIITQVDRDGKPYKTLVTHSTYKYRGASTLQGKGLPVKAKGYKGSTNRKFAEIIRRIDEVVGNKLATLEQAQLHATEMIANMLGGHAIFTDDAIYIADSEDLDEAVKIWKWGIGGFGYSSTGKDGPYTTAITADGTIVAMLVAAGIVTANMIQTGILQSQDGSSWFNLDNGTFNLKNMLKWVDNLLTLNQPDDAARLIVGPNVFAMQAYDETEEDWVNKIYFDPVRGKYVFDGLLSADAIQAVAAVIDYVVSDITFTQILYAEKGNISELTVDQLDTSTMVAKYLASDTSNCNFIKIWGQHIHWIEGVVKDGAPTVQLTDRKGNPLYWVDEESIGMYTTFEQTDYPVMVYEYKLNAKLKMDFELDPVTGYNVPIMTWGMGSDPTGQTNKGKGYIYKDETGLIFRYINEYNKTFDLRIGEDGVQTTGIGDAPASKGLVRNTFVSTDDPGSSDGEDGDVWLRYQDTGGGEE